MPAALELPQEIIASILSHLDPLALAAASQASRLLYRIATHPSLWRTSYLLRWSTGRPQQERRSATLTASQSHLAHQLQTWANTAKSLSTHAQATRRTNGDAATFLFFRPPSSSSTDQQASAAQARDPDFYRLFLERIQIDQAVLDLLYHQVEATHSRISPAEQLAVRFGNDAKDVLSAVVSAQLSAPSGSPDGRPFKGANSVGVKGKGKGNAVAQPSSTRSQLERSQSSQPYRLRAYDAHLPSTMRSDSHHLVILHRAREMLEHLQRTDAMRTLKQLGSDDEAQPATDAQDDTRARFDRTEEAVAMLSMFRGGELYKIREELQVLAAACDLYIQSTRPDLVDDAEHEAGEGRWPPHRPEAKAKAMALAIGDFLKDNGFRGARAGLFQDLDNHFLNHCLDTNRETIPLSLTLIFCAIANRLGLRASLCNFPTRILAVVNFASLHHSSEDGRFWLDVAEQTRPTQTDIGTDPSASRFAPVLTQEDLQRWINQLNLANRTDFATPAKPSQMVVRAARNIVASVQRAQILPRNARPSEGPGAQSDAAEARRETHPQAGRRADGSERPDRLFLKLRHGWVPTEEQGQTYQLSHSDDETAPPPEHFAAWQVLRRFRADSSSFRSVRSPSPVSFRGDFAAWLEARRIDDDWTHRLASQRQRASSWSEHDQQASMYAAANGFVRLTDELGDRGADWIAGLIQSYFPLDVGRIQRDFLGVTAADPVAASAATAAAAAAIGGGRERAYMEAREARAARGEENHSESGSDSSFEGSFSGREERGEPSPAEVREAGRTYIRNPETRFLLSSMMETVRKKDVMEPKVNRRPGRAARSARAARRYSSTTAEAATIDTEAEPSPLEYDRRSTTDEAEDEDPVTFRIGTLFRHRTQRYLACTLGWDSRCAAPEEWIQNMGVDRLPRPPTTTTNASSSSAPSLSRAGLHHSSGVDNNDDWAASPTSPPVRGGFKSTRMKRDRRGGRYQPFYHSQVADGTRRYVAEVNVLPLSLLILEAESGDGDEATAGEAEAGGGDAAEIQTLLRLRGLGEFFRCFDERTGRMRRNREAKKMFPDDLSDDEGGLGDEQQQERGEVEGGALGLHLPASTDSAMQTEMDTVTVERLSEDASW